MTIEPRGSRRLFERMGSAPGIVDCCGVSLPPSGCARLIGVLALVAAMPAVATPACTALGFNNFPQAKSNKLYLYFPARDDRKYKEFGVAGFPTSPVPKFDVAKLGSYRGAASALQSAIVDVVTDDYCEFNVQVIATTTRPPSTFPRRNTVAIGTDRWVTRESSNWGRAEHSDAADQTAVDFARVWAGTYQATGGARGGALQGANSTLERWARSIGGTAAHEAGHNYGLLHSDGVILAPGEELKHHLMASGENYSDEDRAGYRRHFSDHEYTVLAGSVGLSVQTMFNWTFTNPNRETAGQLALDFMSRQPSLTLASVYAGSSSPWAAPVVSSPLGSTTFKGVSYNLYRITWSSGHLWSGGPPGEAPGGADFSVGVSFNAVDPQTPDPVIVTQASLLDGAGNPLALQPRAAGLDAGAYDTSDGTFYVGVTNFQEAPLVIEKATVRFLPRLASIDSLLPGAPRLLDPFASPIEIWSQKPLQITPTALTIQSESRLNIANLREKRRIVEVVDDKACERGDSQRAGPDTNGCEKGINVSLFPATSTLITVDIVDPKARQWNRQSGEYVVAPLRTTINYQLVGRHPDLNNNGVDDFIDIALGHANDRNLDGVIDEARQ